MSCVLLRQACEGEHHLLLQHGCLGREASETRLHWHIPAVPSHLRAQGPFCYPHPAIMQSALQHAFGAVQATSEQQSDESGGVYTSSTGYSHSPPLSPRGKRSVRTLRTLHASPSQDGDSHQGRATISGGSLPKLLAGSPEGADTPDHQQDLPARCRGQKEDVRQRAACELYGLRRLRASPRWALEAAEMSDDSRSAGWSSFRLQHQQQLPKKLMRMHVKLELTPSTHTLSLQAFSCHCAQSHGPIQHLLSKAKHGLHHLAMLQSLCPCARASVCEHCLCSFMPCKFVQPPMQVRKQKQQRVGATQRRCGGPVGL